MKMEKAIELWLAGLRSDLTATTVRTYRCAMDAWKRFLDAKGLADLDIEELTKKKHATSFVIWLGFQGKTRKTASDYLIRLTTMSKWLIKKGYLKSHEFMSVDLGSIHGLRPSTKRVPITPEEYVRVLKAVKEHEPEIYLPCRLGWETGMRSSDILELTEESFNFKERYLTFVPRKTRAFKPDPIQVPISRELSDLIRKHAEQTDAHRYLFRVKWSMNATIRPVMKKAGVNKTFHCFRTACISRMVQAGVSLLMISRITGLSYGTIISYYACPDIESKREALAKVNDRFLYLP